MSLRDLLPLDVTSNAEPREKKKAWGRGDLTGVTDNGTAVSSGASTTHSDLPNPSPDLTVEAPLSVDRSKKTFRIGSRVQPKPGDWVS